ncbi:hypothetical protein I8752_18020 [Nostocaceae cyanobacterium CENA369]|uniref:Uncharacterized protein n=1 Tax=Dendronalium phyllosphericum CENA369 TaxID=1725256 RepID=A0A8J7LIH5_9NOST|nr:hypothetical protein [Dendronalium phyllosphericum]MBH8574884.1 hypothetical protein [Dendronalium phyllosphericum CENA369]
MHAKSGIDENYGYRIQLNLRESGLTKVGNLRYRPDGSQETSAIEQRFS